MMNPIYHLSRRIRQCYRFFPLQGAYNYRRAYHGGYKHRSRTFFLPPYLYTSVEKRTIQTVHILSRLGFYKS